MLSPTDIHFLIEQDVNLGSQQYRDWEPEEIDEAVNTTVFNLTDKAVSKLNPKPGEKVEKLSEIEKLLIRGLTKESCQIPVDNEVDLPEDYTVWVSSESTLIRSDCYKKPVTKIVEKQVYQVVENVLYNGKWYKKDEVFTGTSQSDLFGKANLVQTRKRNSIFLESNLFNSFPNSLSSVYYTIIGDKIKIKSKEPIAKFCLDYVAAISDFKLDSCNGQTLRLAENIQRWVIENTILRLAIRNEESQQKITNMNNI